MTMVFVRKGTFFTQSRVNGLTNSSSVLIPTDPNTTEIVALLCPGYGLGRFNSYRDSNGQWYDVFQSDAPIGTAVYYWVFDMVVTRPSSNFGLQLYDSGGRLTFDSNYQYMSSVAIVSGSGAAFYGDGGRTYAGLTGFGWSTARTYNDILDTDDSDPKHIRYSYAYHDTNLVYGFNINGSVAQIVAIDYGSRDGQTPVPNDQSPPPAGQSFSIPPLNYIIVDVTNL
jgi:hypothetical protein